jgi:hypothetical protein
MSGGFFTPFATIDHLFPLTTKFEAFTIRKWSPAYRTDF